MQKPDEIGELIAQTSLGNRYAFRGLYERTSAKLLGVCLRILSDRSEAEEVLQEVYVKVWRRAGTFSASRARGITWLAAIARNQAIDRLRQRRPAAEPDDILEDISDDAPSPEALAVRSDQNRMMAACLNELKHQHADVVRRTYLAGWSYQDAADAFDVPINTIKTWIRRSLIALRECMSR